MSIELIEQEATKARNVFENNSSNISSIFFADFPKGSCGNASDLLGTWLEDQGVSGLEYVYGEREGLSHGWLEFDGWVIDITSDQFDDGCDPVFVSQNSSFHDSFINQSRLCVGMSSALMNSYNTFSELMGTV